MAVSRRTQKDVGKFEAKLIGPFTAHQCVFVGIGGVLALLLKFLGDALGLPTEVTIVLIVMVAGFCAFLGFKKFNGMTALEYLKLIKDQKMANPGKRLYKASTDLDVLTPREKHELAVKKAEKHEHKPSKEYPSFK